MVGERLTLSVAFLAAGGCTRDFTPCGPGERYEQSTCIPDCGTLPCTDPLAPTSVTISSDRDLLALSVTSSGAPLGSLGIVPSFGGNIPTSIAPSRSDLLLGDSTGGIATRHDGSAGASSFVVPVAADAPFDVNVAIDASFPPSAVPGCRALSPYAQLSCAFPSLVVASDAIIENSGLTVEAYATNGGPNAFGASNTLATHRVHLRRLSGLPSDSPMVRLGGNLIVVLDSKLHVYDDTRLDRITDTAGVGTDDEPGWLTPDGESLYFSALNPSGAKKVFVYDQTANSVAQMSNTRQDNSLSDDPTSLYVSGSSLFFNALDASGFRKVFQLDRGPPVTLTQIADLTGADHDTLPLESQFSDLDDTVYFIANASPGRRKLFAYAGPPATLTQVTEIRTGMDDGVLSLHRFAGALYFSALNGAGVPKLFRFDPTVPIVEQISNTSGANSIADTPEFFLELDGKLFFQTGGVSSFLHYYDPIGDEIVRMASSAPLGGIAQPGHMTVSPAGIYVSGNWSSAIPWPLLRVSPQTLDVEVVAHTGGATATDPGPVIAYGSWLIFGGWDPVPAPRTYAYHSSTGVTHRIASDDLAFGGMQYSNALIFRLVVSGVPRLYRFCDPLAGCRP